jgi:6-phosphogluconolactonase
MVKRIVLIVLPFFLFNSCKTGPEDIHHQITKEMKITYIGTYTKKEDHVDGKAKGIYLVYRDPVTGLLEFGANAAKITNPSFLKVGKDNRNLYVVSELGPGDAPSGYIHSFRIRDDHSLEEIGKVSTESFAPCYIAEDKTGKFIFVANYVGGVVMLYEKSPDGHLVQKQKITLDNPENSHPHSVNITDDNKTVYINDLGNDRIWFFDFNAEEGKLIPHPSSFVQLAEGSGPRHFAFSKSGKFGYSINEHNSTVSSFRITENGELEQLNDISTLPEDFDGENSAADIHLHPSGKFLYTSNRGHNSIVTFELTKKTGKLKLLGHTSTKGQTPRNFGITEDGEFLYIANQDSDNIVSFRIDKHSGKLSETGKELKSDDSGLYRIQELNPTIYFSKI